jgi:hypothetical protein
MADEECVAVSGRPKEEPCPTNNDEAGSSDSMIADATEDSAAGVAGDEEAPPSTKVKMFMSHEGIESILGHKARTDSFKEFQARVAKEVEETGEFEVSEDYTSRTCRRA